ncbi:hypothetical protein CEXT_222721 [Caerostris extrusa]|uniref:Uncharacterized protein n=1 Tax=Caerostris extrusa TaxID=172846 RepID=A0AAV4WX51_CAEEX|nr:hypothetical protein CEXT_222721 [Caerostris extrusa]
MKNIRWTPSPFVFERERRVLCYYHNHVRPGKLITGRGVAATLGRCSPVVLSTCLDLFSIHRKCPRNSLGGEKYNNLATIWKIELLLLNSPWRDSDQNRKFYFKYIE